MGVLPFVDEEYKVDEDMQGGQDLMQGGQDLVGQTAVGVDALSVSSSSSIPLEDIMFAATREHWQLNFMDDLDSQSSGIDDDRDDDNNDDQNAQPERKRRASLIQTLFNRSLFSDSQRDSINDDGDDQNSRPLRRQANLIQGFLNRSG